MPSRWPARFFFWRHLFRWWCAWCSGWWQWRCVSPQSHPTEYYQTVFNVLSKWWMFLNWVTHFFLTWLYVYVCLSHLCERMSTSLDNGVFVAPQLYWAVQPNCWQYHQLYSGGWTVSRWKHHFNRCLQNVSCTSFINFDLSLTACDMKCADLKLR